MATLTEISIKTRKAIRYSVFGIIFIIFARILVKGGISLYKYFFPAPPPPPTVSYGKLPSIPFPASKSIDNVTFNLETVDGNLPTFDTQEYVYVMPKPAPTLSSLEEASIVAKDLGFLPTGEEVSQTIYRFTHKDAPSTLEYDISTKTFSLSYNLAEDSSPTELIPPAADTAASYIRTYLSSADIDPADLTGPVTHTFLKIENGNLVEALGQSDADLVKVSLYRKAFNDLPSVTPRANESNIWFMVSGSREKAKQFVAGEYHYFPVDETQSSTYPIKTTDEAWSELNNKTAYVVSTPSSGQVTVRKIYLAYYDPGTPSDFYQPVFVFEGDDGFLAYIPAVTSDYYGE